MNQKEKQNRLDESLAIFEIWKATTTKNIKDDVYGEIRTSAIVVVVIAILTVIGSLIFNMVLTSSIIAAKGQEIEVKVRSFCSKENIDSIVAGILKDKAYDFIRKTTNAKVDTIMEIYTLALQVEAGDKQAWFKLDSLWQTKDYKYRDFAKDYCNNIYSRLTDAKHFTLIYPDLFATDSVTKRLKDQWPSVRTRAIYTLYERGLNKEAVPILLDIVKNDNNIYVISAANVALNEYLGKGYTLLDPKAYDGYIDAWHKKEKR